ncbi:MAG: GNAT family N-acetyltransferase [Spirochaetaceae bacterium]|nr:GNAT family N-acetyltransferase [Spirochaetaceae bacterium]
MDIQFRDIKKQDIEKMVQMSAEVGYKIRYEKFSERISELIKNSNIGVIAAANEENKIVGWVQLEISNFIFSDKACNILGVFIDKNYRGNQIGRKLIEKAQEWAREKGCISFKISSDITRIDSHAFYKHMGFKHIKTEQIFGRRVEKEDQQD